MWTKLMCRLWAIAHEPEYRNRAVKNILIFFSAFYLICELTIIGEWNLGDIAVVIGSVTLLIYLGFIQGKELFWRLIKWLDKR